MFWKTSWHCGKSNFLRLVCSLLRRKKFIESRYSSRNLQQNSLLSKLPNDVLYHITQYLDKVDICSLAQVSFLTQNQNGFPVCSNFNVWYFGHCGLNGQCSKMWSRFCNTPRIWYRFYKESFGDSIFLVSTTQLKPIREQPWKGSHNHIFTKSQLLFHTSFNLFKNDKDFEFSLW